MPTQSTRLPRGTGKSEQVCAVCGAPFLAYASQHRRYCSKPCQLIGHPKTQPYNPAKRDAAFWAKVRKSDTCWLWLGMTNPSGYGEMKQDGRVLLTHRIAFERAYGSIPDHMIIGHTCDTPGCCRNDDEGWYEVNGLLRPRRGHLWLGTHQDNQADKIAKERQAVGEHQGSAKLTPAFVREIRARHAMGDMSFVDLAAEYGIGESQAARIVKRESWRHID